MPKRIEVRPFTPEEQSYLDKVSRSRKAAKQLVERASILLRSAAGERVGAIAVGVGRRPETVLHVVKRFNARGIASLADGLRSGRPLVYREKERGQMISTAKTHPQQLKLTYSHWTLDRRLEYVQQQLKIPVSRSQLGEILEQEGLKWYQEKTYFTESPDPQFAEKRGR
jgi:putative transposase